MTAKELISQTIPPLKTSDTGEKALRWMNEFHVIHMPIVNNTKFLGLISEEDILNLSQPEEALGNHELSLFRPFVSEDVHIFEVIKTAAEQKLSLIPVIDVDENYLGVITLQSLVNYFADINSLKSTGGIITLSVNTKDYSMAEIARIVESNDVSILSSYLTSHPDSTLLEITLKLNSTELHDVVATFERYEYTVKGTYREADEIDGLKDRFDSFMRYMSI